MGFNFEVHQPELVSEIGLFPSTSSQVSGVAPECSQFVVQPEWAQAWPESNGRPVKRIRDT